jgi:hypothetical protein
MNEDDVRAMLRERAAAVQPSRDGLERIEAKLEGVSQSQSPVARRLPLLAAAVVVVVALVGAVLLAQGDDDGTPVVTATTTTSTSTSSTAAPNTVTEGVFPAPGDDVDPAALHDPAALANAYLDARLGDAPRVRTYEYQEGDARSGEVVFHGSVETTVLVRQGMGDRWFVVGSASDLLPVHDAGEGEVVMTADTAGDAHGAVRSATGAVAPVELRHVTEPGTELWRGTAGGAWFALDTVDGAIGLAEVQVVTPEPPAAEDAVLPSAGAGDPRDAVVAYLKDVLGDGLTVNDFTPVDATHGEVTWEAGVVKVVKQGDRWFPEEAIGDSIQIAGTSIDSGYIGGSLTLAQAGTVHLSVGTVTWDVRNDVDREGTTVRFEHEIPTDEKPIVLRAVFTTDSGYVSVAEKVVG